MEYYRLRFQIEFDFRDVKQFFGLAHFKNIKQTQVTNAVNMAFSYKVIGQVLVEKYKKLLQVENFSIIDLKAVLRAELYYNYLFNTSQKQQNNFLSDENFLQFVKFDSINA